MTDSVFFAQVIAHFQSKYPHRNIEVRKEWGDDMIYIDGQLKFNATGWSALYNTTRLCEALKDELS